MRFAVCQLDESRPKRTLKAMRCLVSFSPSGRRPTLAITALGLFAAICQSLPAAPVDALAEYVGRPDSSFTWKRVEQRQVDDLTAVRLECTSQTWRGHVWRHEILVVRPPEVRNPAIAFFSIGGHGNVERQFELLRTMATRGGTIAAAINRVPNQPFYDGRKEDALIAYTFDQYLKTGDTALALALSHGEVRCARHGRRAGLWVV